MSKTEHFSIKHFNNSLDLYSSKTKLYSSSWFMGFGKFGSEIFNAEEKKYILFQKNFNFGNGKWCLQLSKIMKN